ncbi:MAG: hypothetical protein R3B93_17415 [Bacteroidia bacterium]
MANPYSGFSQQKDIEKARSEIYQGYISNNPNLWNAGIDILKRGYTQTKNDVYRYELALAYYGKIGFFAFSERGNCCGKTYRSNNCTTGRSGNFSSSMG